MTATHNTRRPRKTTTRTRRGRGLRIHWGWTITGLVVFLGVAKTWPTFTGILFGITAPAVILYAIRPHRLAHIWRAIDRALARRRALPRPDRGYRPLHLFQQMHPAQFEQAIAELALEDRDHVATAITVGGTNDRGADVLVHLNDGRRILIQCKKYRPGNNVGSQVVQTINGVYRDIHHCHSAVIVTTALFTPDAYDTNRLLPQPIRLINGPQLEAWANGGPTPW